MNNKTRMIIIVIVILVLVVLLVISKNNKKRANIVKNREDISIKTSYNEEEYLYRVINDNTGEVIYEGESEADAYLYKIDPLYIGSNPDSMDEYNDIDKP